MMRRALVPSPAAASRLVPLALPETGDERVPHRPQRHAHLLFGGAQRLEPDLAARHLVLAQDECEPGAAFVRPPELRLEAAALEVGLHGQAAVTQRLGEL